MKQSQRAQKIPEHRSFCSDKGIFNVTLENIISMSLFQWKVPWAMSLDKVSGMEAYSTFQVTLLSSSLLPVS